MRLSSALRIVVTCSGGREPLGVAPASDWNQFWLDLQEFLRILDKRSIDPARCFI